MQGFMEFNEAAKCNKEENDKDLPFTPDVKKTKPSTPGKYGSAYSTVRNLARQAMQKQAKKLNKEEVHLAERSDLEKSHIEQSLANKDINSKVEGNKVHVHKDNVAKTKATLKKLGYTGHTVHSGLNEEEQLDELKKSTLANYVNKAARKSYHAGYISGEGKYKKQAGEYASKRLKGIERATSKLAKEEEGGKISIGEEALIEKLDKKEELRAALNRHSQHAIEANRRGDDEAVKVHQGYMNKIKDKMAKLARNEEIEPHYKRYDADAEQERRDREEDETKAEREKTELAKRTKMKEETEQIDELKKSTLSSYIDKAAGGSLKGVAYHAWDAGSKSASGDKEGSEKAYAKAKKRSDGIQTAAKKLAKEELKKEELDMKTFSQFMEEIQEIEEAKKDDYWDFKDLKEPSNVRKIAGKAYGGAAQKDDEDEDHPVANKATEKRGRGRPKGSTSGARTAGAAKKSYGGLTFHSLNLPNSNK